MQVIFQISDGFDLDSVWWSVYLKMVQITPNLGQIEPEEHYLKEAILAELFVIDRLFELIRLVLKFG